jgi:hypothetical protein
MRQFEEDEIRRRADWERDLLALLSRVPDGLLPQVRPLGDFEIGIRRLKTNIDS